MAEQWAGVRPELSALLHQQPCLHTDEQLHRRKGRVRKEVEQHGRRARVAAVPLLDVCLPLHYRYPRFHPPRP